MNIETLRIAELTPDTNNARQHDDKNLKAIMGSLKEFGQRKPIVITEAGTIVAGNGTVEAAKRLGWLDIEVVKVPNDWTPDKVKAFAIADNRTAELANWNQEVLTSQLLELEAEGWELAEFGFEAFELPDEDKPIVEDEPLEFDSDEPIISKVGDIWQIGQHRIACGDSTDQTLITRLTDGLIVKAIITDPPYGIDIVSKKGNGTVGNIGWEGAAKAGNYRPVIGDESSDVAAISFQLVQELYPKTIQCWWGGNHYTGKAQLPDSSCWLVWNKDNGASHFADAELAFTNAKTAVRVFTHQWMGMIRASERGKAVRIHPTQKPTALTQWVIETLKIEKGSVILDLFAGSGSTLVGAADSDCIGIGIELDPFYVDKIVSRLEKQSGQKAELLPAKAH
jgi:hypothetical protein